MKIRIHIFTFICFTFIFNSYFSVSVFADEPADDTKKEYRIIFIDETEDENEEENLYSHIIENSHPLERYKLNSDDKPLETKANIGSNKKDAEHFDVAKGIPTNKPLYCEVLSNKWIVDLYYSLHEADSVHDVTVSKTYHLTWFPDGPKEPPASDVETVSTTYTVITSAWFYTIDKLAVYTADRVELDSDIFENNHLIIEGAEDLGANIEVIKHKNHIMFGYPKGINTAAPSESIVGGASRPAVPSEDLSKYANKAVSPPHVRNDKFVFNDEIIMSDVKAMPRTPVPSFDGFSIPTDKGFFYKSGIMIPELTQNGIKNIKGNTVYKALININIEDEKRVKIDEINNVLVHSPVVAYPKCQSRIDIVQKSEIDEALSQLVIGDSFKISFPFDGEHRNIKGYGTRSYEDSTKAREVRFPFDVFRGINKSGEYFPKNTWIEMKKIEEEYFIPEWVKEKESNKISFRAIANNYVGTNTFEENHNINYVNYKAVDIIDVSLVGKVFDFQIDASTDPAHKTHFSTDTGYFKSGDKDEFGREEKHNNYLPFNGFKLDDKRFSGSHLKLGYKFRYSFKTSGDMLSGDDIVVITPKYKLLTTKGKLMDIDLYYKIGDNIKPIDYKVKNYIVLNLSDRKISKNEFKNTAKVYKLKDGSAKSSTKKYYKKMIQKRPYNTQYRDKIILSARQKTFVGDYESLSEIDGLDEADVRSSIQKWYGDFYLPASTLVVPKGMKLSNFIDLDISKAPFIQKGAIIVSFDIDVYHNISKPADLKNTPPYISYTTKKWGNQWRREGFKTEQVWRSDKVTYDYGTVAVYDLAKKSYNNYK